MVRPIIESRKRMESRDSMRDAQDKSMKGLELAAIDERNGDAFPLTPFPEPIPKYCVHRPGARFIIA